MNGTQLADKLAELRAGFKPSARRSNSSLGGNSSVDGGDDLELGGAGARVVVRCRPGRSSEAQFAICSSDPLGRDKVSLRVDAPRDALDRVGPEASRTFRCSAFYGPKASQEDIFAEASPIVESVMRGGNASIMCYGATGAGKTHTMSGPRGDGLARESMSGVTQRVSKRIFEYIRDRSLHGEVFLVEVSFLQIYSQSGTDQGEQLVDLLGDSEKSLEIVPEPLNSQAFMCEGLTRRPIERPDELCDALSDGQRRGEVLEAELGREVHKSHCVFTVMVESLAEQPGAAQPLVRRGKLVLADLAGSETRSLSSLYGMTGRLNGSPHGQEPALNMLLRDSLGGSARALVVANVGPELAGLAESVKTLNFAHQMLSAKGGVGIVRTASQQATEAIGASSLLQMRQRHAECIRMLQEKVNMTQQEEQQERSKLQKEMEDLNKKLVTKESAEKTLEEMRDEQLQKIDQMKEEMSMAMTKELERMREHSLQDLHNLRQSVEQHVTTLSAAQQQQYAEEQESLIQRMQADLQEAARAQKAAEDESAELRVRLASVEERAKMLQARQEELRKERQSFEEERRDLRQQGEQQWQKLMAAENELQRCKAEAEVQRAELGRLQAARAEEEEAGRRERETWRARESELQQEVVRLRAQVDEARREAEMQLLRSTTEQKEAIGHLKLQVERLEDEASARRDQLQHAQSACARLEAEKNAALQRAEELKSQMAREIQGYVEDIEEAKAREAELTQMLSDIQDNIINATHGNGAR